MAPLVPKTIFFLFHPSPSSWVKTERGRLAAAAPLFAADWDRLMIDSPSLSAAGFRHTVAVLINPPACQHPVAGRSRFLFFPVDAVLEQ